MRVLVLPDVHGNSTPLEIAKRFVNEADKVIFLGDYVDSHEEGNNWLQQKKCLSAILDFKHIVNRDSKDKVITLLGNHDLSYLTRWSADSSVSGHQHFQATDIQEFFCNNFEEFDAIVVTDKWIFSHAGVTRLWLENPVVDKWSHVGGRLTLKTVNKNLHSGDVRRFNHNSFDPYGDDPQEGCMWIRPTSLINYGISGYHQVVGHTNINDEEIEKDRDWWGLNSRIMTRADLPIYRTFRGNRNRNKDCKYVFIDSAKQDHYAIVDTETNKVEVFKDE